ncbi:hypothetical protein LG293_17180 (plasmid) [Citricoccus nitrophenolicus]
MNEALTHWWVYVLFAALSAPAFNQTLLSITAPDLTARSRLVRAWVGTGMMVVAALLPSVLAAFALVSERVAQSTGYLGSILVVVTLVPAMHLLANHVTAAPRTSSPDALPGSTAASEACR